MIKAKLATVFILLSVFIFQVSVKAQTGDSLGKIIKGGSVEMMREYFSLKMALTNNLEIFTVNDGMSEYDFAPNTTVATRFSLNYRILSLSFSVSPKFFPGNDDDAIRGKSKNFGMGGGLTFSHWFTELSYNRTSGYYLENTGDHDPSWKPGDAYAQIPELVVTSFEGGTAYSFNSRFSQASLLTQTERQLKSAGSFIPRLSYRYYIVDDQTDHGTTQKSNNFQVLLGAGYHYNFVIKRQFYVYAGLTPSFGYIFTRLLTRFPTEYSHQYSNSPVFQLDGRAGAGYNGERFFAGGYFSVIASSYIQEHTSAVNGDAKGYYQLFIGYRFRTPKFVRNTYDNINGKVKKMAGM